jgi:hypothetical protein
MKSAAAALCLTIIPCDAWTTRKGVVFEADLAAADGLRATFTRPEKPPVVMPLADLSAADVETIGKWRANRLKPLVVPSKIAPWPPRAVAPAGDVRFTGEKNGVFSHESANFTISSDLRLPLSTVNDIAKVLEGTRAALIAIPLGLHAGGERSRYKVDMFRDKAGYTAAGGANGSGGHYDSRHGRMLVLLPNLGIEEIDGKLRLDHAKHLFILKHEVTHQLIDRWHGRMPMWVYEGIAEFIASLPYAQGHYTLRSPGAGMRDYLTKWSAPGASRGISLIAPAQLMAMDRDDWEDAVSQQGAYDRYNSAALLTYYFIQRDHGAPLAGYLDALRRGESQKDAERHLLGGKSLEWLNGELVALCKKLGVELQSL